jgi:hypothetical protein
MSQISKQALIVDNNQSFPTNNAGEITPSDLRAFNVNMIDSLVNEIPYQSFTASVTNSINLLNAFTQSQQPSFTNLNAFTASQLTINTGYNQATSSLATSIAVVSSEVNQLQIWTSSVNEISFNSQIPQYATRWNFGGFISASFVPNVNGLIADITVLNDPSKLNTSSFNAYTASTDSSISNLNQFSASTLIRLTNIESTTASLNNSVSNLNAFTQSQITFNNSATASILQLQSFSSSLSGGFATQGELDASSSQLQNNIDTKLNTSSFNDYTASFGSLASLNLFTASANTYTASNDTKWTTLGLLTGSYATTGSNTFIGNQTIVGTTTITDSITITGSAYGNVVSASIVSSTASIDLSAGNYFTLTIASDTNINVTNAQPGVTATLVINTAGATTASFSSNVKQSSGSFYVPSVSGNIDILSFTAVTTSSVYVVPAYTFV